MKKKLKNTFKSLNAKFNENGNTFKWESKGKKFKAKVILNDKKAILTVLDNDYNPNYIKAKLKKAFLNSLVNSVELLDFTPLLYVSTTMPIRGNNILAGAVYYAEDNMLENLKNSNHFCRQQRALDRFSKIKYLNLKYSNGMCNNKLFYIHAVQ